MFTYDAATKQTGDRIYESYRWDEPPWLTTDAWGGKPVVTRAIKMVADYDNQENRDIVWGSFVDENEHMETYVMSYPHLEVSAECICHREGEPPIKTCP